MMKCQPNAEEETHGNIYEANHKKTYKSRSCLKVISIIWTCLLSRFFPFLSFDLTWCDLVLSSQSCLQQTLCTSTARILKMVYLKIFEIKLFKVPAKSWQKEKWPNLSDHHFVCVHTLQPPKGSSSRIWRLRCCKREQRRPQSQLCTPEIQESKANMVLVGNIINRFLASHSKNKEKVKVILTGVTF